MQKTKTLVTMILLAILIVPTAIQISQVDTAAALEIKVYIKVMAEPEPIGAANSYTSAYSSQNPYQQEQQGIRRWRPLSRFNSCSNRSRWKQHNLRAFH